MQIVAPILLAATLLMFAPAQAVAASEKSAPAVGPKAETASTNFEALATQLVTQNARVKEGEIVVLNGATRDIDLLEAIAVNVRKVGAWPLITLGSDRMNKRMFTDVPEKFDAQPPALEMKMNDIANVLITVDPEEIEGVLADIPPDRVQARATASAPANKQMLQNNVRLVSVGNDLYPTAWRARRYSMQPDEMAQMFWEAVSVDAKSIEARGEKVSAKLRAGKEMRITKKNGTDLKLRIEGRPIIVSDGIISDEDTKKGGAALLVYLPAGEVMTTPVVGSAEGKVVVDHLDFQGKPVEQLTLDFAAGKVTSLTGNGEGFAPLKEAYDAGDAGKDLFGFVDFGINEKVRLSPNSKTGTYAPAGIVTIGIGNNLPFGGENESTYGLAAFLLGVTVTLDRQPVVEEGKLKI